ncbi:MAG: type II secretion system F family protein [Candidatus Woesearchaeota archaeon]
MKNKVPLSIVPVKLLRKISQIFSGLGGKLERSFPSLKLNLEQAGMDFTPQEYIAMCMTSSLISFVFLNIIFNINLFVLKIENPPLLSLLISVPLVLFILIQQLLYPKLRAGRKIKDIEKNLLPALQDMLVQLTSGVPLFMILVNLSEQSYGEVSKEFAGTVKKISAGIAQVSVLDELASKNPSLYFRRAIWQLVNGMKTGSDTAMVVKEIISALSEEQLIQIQRYGGQLNPLAMFYMLVTVIMPSLGMTFLIIISSFISTSEFITKLIFWGLYGFVFFFQIMFLGIIKTKRPTLLER